MPILDRSPKHTFDRFENHVEQLARRLLPMPGGTKFDLCCYGIKERATLSFVKGGAGIATSVPVETNAGRLFLSMTQHLIAERDGRTSRYRLRTEKYAYRLALSNEGRAKAVIRWEYDRHTADHVYGRHHLHIRTAFPTEGGQLDFDDLHVPTRFVLMEDIFRFLFHDLGVNAKDADWPKVLRESETAFYEQFSGKRYKHR